mmetsp:Transcript_1044/g.1150  ORF Transcript_1044/g.1150 Transcript_1044/m.1150 type:complete len:84 (+) Transcript_1044:24-275(+)
MLAYWNHSAFDSVQAVTVGGHHQSRGCWPSNQTAPCYRARVKKGFCLEELLLYTTTDSSAKGALAVSGVLPHLNLLIAEGMLP